MQQLSDQDFQRLHDATMSVLKKTGVIFHAPEAVAVFRRHGFKTCGKTVFFEEAQVLRTLATTPADFCLIARNPEKNLYISTTTNALAPGYGAPFILKSDGKRLPATLADYQIFCKLIQTSKVLDSNGFMMVEPSDLPPNTAHLEMLLAGISLCDKPFMGSPLSRRAAMDALEMAKIVWGKIPGPVMMSNINSMAPLQFAGEMAEALMEFAGGGQPVIITGGGILGSTCPITIPGLLVVQNAVVLAGITLAQLVQPGAPVIYGVAGSPMDMQTGAYYVGGPEFSQAVSAGVQMAHRYNLPCRGGGALTAAFRPDFQAGMEAAISLFTGITAGANFVLHACGILGTYIAMSYEKFLMDEVLVEHLRKVASALSVTDESIDLATIQEVGAGGMYLTHAKTLDQCRTAFFRSKLIKHEVYDRWLAAGGKSLDRIATELVSKRLETYSQPDMDPGVKADLSRYVALKKERP